MGRFRKANLVQEQAADVLATVIHGLREGNDKHIPDLQRTACGALDSFGSLAEAAVGELAAALRSPIPDIRRAAAFTLAPYRPPRESTSSNRRTLRGACYW
jgi:hypothetical protein